MLSRIFKILLLFIAFVRLSAETKRDLSEIQYKFTPCGTTGRLGPSFSDCRDHYTATNSPIIRDEVLFEFENRDFQGAQGFRVPKDGLYNITIGGATGGRGICNSVLVGSGVIRAVQVNLTTEFELLIMVGQKGVEPCSFIPMSDPVYEEICSSPPEHPSDSAVCNSTWYNLTREYHREFYEVFGGAGGGGASMVRARNRTSGIFDDLPIVIAGGGGGTPAILDFDIVEDIDAVTDGISFGNATPNAISYSSYINGRSRTVDIEVSGLLLTGTRGSRISSGTQTAGAGGGYSDRIIGTSIIPADGRLFRFPHDFADGGVDCARIQSLSQTGIGSVPFRGSFGGFGGGGGACGGGGGGGGYTGGDVRGVGNTVPASGGFSYTGGLHSTSFDVITIRNDSQTVRGNRTDGFVTIVLENCGCAHECTVYEDDAQFECTCRNNTVLAPDLSDCFFEWIPNSFMVHPVSSSVLNTSLIPLPSSMFLFGINAILSNDRTESADCVLIFLGSKSQVVAVSNTVSMPGVANKLALVDSVSNTTSTLPLTYMDLLSSPVLVTGALLVGTAQCSLGTMMITFLVSIRDTPSSAVPIQELSTAELVSALGFAQEILFSEATTSVSNSNPTSEETSGLSEGGIAGIVIGIIVILVLIILISLIILFMLQKNHATKLKVLRDEEPTSPRYVVSTNDFRHKDSLIPCSAYTSFGSENPSYSMQDINQPATDGYEQLLFPNGGGKNETGSFQPRYGVDVPVFDFVAYNRKRSGSVVTASEWQYHRSNLIYMRELGEGQFGKVLLMKAQDIAGFEGKIPVAVKTLTSRDPEVIDKFKEEAELMKKFAHPNIVSLLGYIPQEEGEDSAPLMILEYMPYGDLLEFLNSHRPTSEKRSMITEQHFYSFGTDIAKGLEFLSENNYVHRDIAARNCLVGSGLRIKIADFGLARGLQAKDYYKIVGSAVLPVKWMAPECLLFGIFTSASDVWSFGVLLWEITTYGESPLGDADVQSIIEACHDGTLKHSRPKNCPDDLYSLMCQCHHHDKDERPTFSEIVQVLSNFSTDADSPLSPVIVSNLDTLEESMQI